MSRWTQGAVVAACAALAAACNRAKVEKCHELMEASQPLVRDIAPNSLDSVEGAASAVEAALLACKEAERETEVRELGGAHEQLVRHIGALKEREARENRRKIAPAELSKLVERGDPNCPKGQAYKHRASGKEIRCIGPQPIRMSYEQAKRYFVARGYNLLESPRPEEVVAEYGAEKFVFEYARAGDTRPPRCATIYPPPGMSWQEAVARLTGASPARLELDEPVPTPIGKLPLEVQQGKNELTVKLGSCGANE
jgi:hypothetical protein